MRIREMQPVLLLEISSFIRSTCVSWETGGDGLETASGVSRMIHLRLWMRARTKSPSNDSLFALLAIVKFDPYHDWSVETPGLGWIQPLTFSPRFHWAVTSREERREYTGEQVSLPPPPLLAPQMVSQRNSLCSMILQADMTQHDKCWHSPTPKSRLGGTIQHLVTLRVFTNKLIVTRARTSVTVSIVSRNAWRVTPCHVTCYILCNCYAEHHQAKWCQMPGEQDICSQNSCWKEGFAVIKEPAEKRWPGPV